MNLHINYLCIFFSFVTLNLHANEGPLIELSKWEYLTQNSNRTSLPFNKLDSLKTLNWKSIENPSEIAVRKGDKVFLKTTLPLKSDDNTVLYFGQITYPVKVYLNNRLIYNFGNFSKFNKKYIRWNQIIVNLPDYNKNSNLIIEAEIGDEFNGMFEKLLLGSSLDIFKYLINSDLLLIFLMIFSFFIGVSSLLFFFFADKSILILAFTLFLFSVTILLGVNLSIIQLLVNLPVLYLHLNYSMFGFASVFMFIIVGEVVQLKYKFWINLIWKIRLLILIATILLLSFSDLAYFNVVSYIAIYTIAGFTVSLVCLYFSATKSSYESNVLFWGISGIVISALFEISIFYIKGAINTTYGYKIVAIPFGIMIFINSIIWLAVFNIIRTKREKEESQKLAFDLIESENEVRKQFSEKLIESEENERNRIALELHDSIGQKLLIIKNNISLLIKNEDQKSNEILSNIDNTTSETIGEIRTITSKLHPPILSKVGLTSAIETLIENIATSTNIELSFSIDEIDNVFPKELEINFYRIVQESLNNIVKHSEAKEAFIKITKDESNIKLEVKDNGKGIENYETGGIGLVGMKERARILGSEINIISNNKGTFIEMNYQIME